MMSDTKKNLFDRFSLDTEYKEPGSGVSSDNNDVNVNQNPAQTHDDDIDDDIDDDVDDDIDDMPDETAEQDIKDDKFKFKKEKSTNTSTSNASSNYSKTRDKKSTDVTAEIYIGVIDTIQAMSLRKLIVHKAKKKIGGEVEMTKALDIMDDCEKYGEAQVIPKLSVEERTALRLAKKMTTKIDELPFSDDEITKIKVPLVTMLENSPDLDLPPGAVLTLAISQVMIPRIVDAFID